MEEWLPFAMSWWHALAAGGRDPFGVETALRPWNGKEAFEASRMRVEAGFEFMDKLGINYFCFHDRDIAPEMSTLKETNLTLDRIAKGEQAVTVYKPIKLLATEAARLENKKLSQEDIMHAAIGGKQ